MTTFITVRQLLNGQWETLGAVIQPSKTLAYNYIDELETGMKTRETGYIAIRCNVEEVILADFSKGPIKFRISE